MDEAKVSKSSLYNLYFALILALKHQTQQGIQLAKTSLQQNHNYVKTHILLALLYSADTRSRKGYQLILQVISQNARLPVLHLVKSHFLMASREEKQELDIDTTADDQEIKRTLLQGINQILGRENNQNLDTYHFHDIDSLRQVQQKKSLSANRYIAYHQTLLQGAQMIRDIDPQAWHNITTRLDPTLPAAEDTSQVEYLWQNDREKAIEFIESWATREETGDSLFWLAKARGEKDQTEESSRLLGRAYGLALAQPVLRYDRLSWMHYL